MLTWNLEKMIEHLFFCNLNQHRTFFLMVKVVIQSNIEMKFFKIFKVVCLFVQVICDVQCNPLV
jgi:hypothetical protein